jgi:hypothetical protein
LFERRVGPPLPREFDHFIIGKPSPHPLYGRGGPLKGREGTGSPSNPEHDNGEAVLIMPAPGLADPHPSVGASPPGTERRGTPNPANESPPSAPERRNDMRPAKPLPNHLKPKGGPSDLPVAGGASGATVKPR